MTYQPEPIDTSRVRLPVELEKLIELLARNTHEHWALGRLAAGWHWGERRDDGRKEHPCLVPYPELPDAEKAFDRTTARETLRALLALGYGIQPPAAEPIPAVVNAAVDCQRLIDDPAADLRLLLNLWRERDLDVWASAPALYRALGDRLLRAGTPMLANEVVREGLERWPRDVRLRQVQGLALVNSGAIERANRILEELESEGQTDEETLGLLARTHKDLGLLSTDTAQRQRHMALAFQAYAKAYRQYKNYWAGINVSAVALLLNRVDTAQATARAVHAQCLPRWEGRDANGEDAYWLAATLGEACLIQQQWSEAEEWYARAADLGRGRLGHRNSTRRQARLLLDQLGQDPDRLDRVLHIPRVVLLAGLPIDRPGHSAPRFPAALEEAVAAAIAEQLDKLGGGVGFASAACGSDILFLEAMLKRGGEVQVVLPYARDFFARDQVTYPKEGRWAERLDAVLSHAAGVTTASSQKMAGGTITHDYASLVLHGLATVRATELQTELVGLAVSDGRLSDGPAGPGRVVERWRRLGLRVEQIDLAAVLRRQCPSLDLGGETVDFDLPEPDFDTPIMAMLFADAVNYSKLTEEQVPRFVQDFLGAIAELLRRSPNTSVVKNTWGDGLYFVFPSVRDAGLFALDLCELVAGIDWAEKRLPAGLNLRIALHAGPVYRCQDPITGQMNYTGTHVSRAARMEPITPPGHVYASQAFAALATVEGIREFRCDYVKLAALPKGYGIFPTYRVRRYPERSVRHVARGASVQPA